jgi:hypothetical protein
MKFRDIIVEENQEEIQLDEGTLDAIQNVIFKKLYIDEYKMALELMKKKNKSAADVAKIFKHVDARMLADMEKELRGQ